MLTGYALAPSQWRTTPLESPLPDDDDAYPDVALRPGEVTIAELTECITRPVYDKPVDIHGNADSSMLLGGGMKGGKVYGVETVVRGLEVANRMLKVVSDGEYQLVVVEIIRRPLRQRSGHKKAYLQMLAAAGITDPTPAQILVYGRKASRIFSYPKPVKDEGFAALVGKLRSNATLFNALNEVDGLPANTLVDSLLVEYASIIASLDVNEAIGAGIRLPATHIVHGGGAADFFIADAKGRILSVVPFDYPNAKLAAYRFTESDENYDVLIAEAQRDPLLRDHFRKLGYAEPSLFTRSHWRYFQEANRMQVRLIIAMNGTTYMDERWHFEFGTIVTDFYGNPVVSDSLASEFPLSGGTGYTSIRQGKSGTAVWHTAVTETALRKQGLIDD